MRPWTIWIVFGHCAVAVIQAMAWVSWSVLGLERTEMQAQAEAEVEENVRLALWRMDSALAPLISKRRTDSLMASTSKTPVRPRYPVSAQKLHPCPW